MDEWIELYNSGAGAQELTGWTLCADDFGTAIVTFSAANRIEQGAFFLIERTDDTTVSDIDGDYISPFSKTLVDGGLHMTLRDGSCVDGVIIDEIGQGPWYAGQPTANRTSMERMSASAAGTDSANWATWGTIPDSNGNVDSTGRDAGGNPIKGTPKFKNSVTP